MNERLTGLLDALDGVRLLARRPEERGVVYGYVSAGLLEAVTSRIVATLVDQHYAVHRCAWRGEIVLLALKDGAEPLALRLISSADERYRLYALSRPQSAQALWQWAQTASRRQSRRRHES